MRINKLVAGLLVLGLAVGMAGMIGLAKQPSASATDKVTWTIQKFVELTIDDSSFDFGTIPAGVDSVSKKNANTLFVFSNTAWTLSFSVKGDGIDHLGVSLSAKEGKGDAKVGVGYSLNDLRSMDPGTYTATVTYTVAAK